MGFPKARPGSAFTIDIADNAIETDLQVEDAVGNNGEIIWWSPWIVDTAPSAGEGTGAIAILAGDWPHPPQEVPFPTAGLHLTAIGSPILTARQRWLIHGSISAGQKITFRGESYDTVASNGRAGYTAFYSNTPPAATTVYSKFTRETSVTAAGETALADLTLPGASTLLEAVALWIPSGVLTADIEIAGRVIIRSDSMKPINEISFDIEPWSAMEATSGVSSQASVWRQELVDYKGGTITTDVSSITLTAKADLDVVVTTMTSEAGYGVRYYKRVPSTNPRAR